MFKKPSKQAETTPPEGINEVNVVHALFKEGQKTGNFRQWELASTAVCRNEYGWWDTLKGDKYLRSICRDPKEFGAFAAMMCKIGTFGFDSQANHTLDSNFFPAFAVAIKNLQRTSERKWVINHLTGQEKSPSSLGDNVVVVNYQQGEPLQLYTWTRIHQVILNHCRLHLYLRLLIREVTTVEPMQRY